MGGERVEAQSQARVRRPLAGAVRVRVVVQMDTSAASPGGRDAQPHRSETAARAGKRVDAGSGSVGGTHLFTLEPGWCRARAFRGTVLR